MCIFTNFPISVLRFVVIILHTTKILSSSSDLQAQLPEHELSRFRWNVTPRIKVVALVTFYSISDEHICKFFGIFHVHLQHFIKCKINANCKKLSFKFAYELVGWKITRATTFIVLNFWKKMSLF